MSIYLMLATSTSPTQEEESVKCLPTRDEDPGHPTTSCRLVSLSESLFLIWAALLRPVGSRIQDMSGVLPTLLCLSESRSQGLGHKLRLHGVGRWFCKAGLLSPGVSFQSCVSARALGHREMSVPIISQDLRIEGRHQPSWGLGREGFGI